MTINRNKLLIVTPLILSAMASGAAAQESKSASSLLMLSAQTLSSEATQQVGVVIPMKIIVSRGGTYVFSAPANSNVSLRINGETLIESSATSAGAVKVFTTLASGTHLLEAFGEDLTMEKLAQVTANLIGMPTSSIASLAEVVSTEEAARLAPLATNRTFATPPSSSSSLTGEDLASSSLTQNLAAETVSQVSTRDVQSSLAGGIFQTFPLAETGRTEVKGVLRNTIRNALTAAIASNPSSGGGGTPVVTPPVVTPPPVIGAGDAQSSALSPPTGVALTQAVQITGGATEDGVVGANGQTLFGGVMDPNTFDTVNVSIAPSGRTATVDVGPTTGQFAVRLFPEDLVTGEATVTLTGVSSADDTVTTVPVSYEFDSGAVVDGVSQALSRMTFGPTEDLYSRVRTIGFENFVNEQLNPGSIRNAAFNSMDFDNILDTIDNNNSGTIARPAMRYHLAHAAFSERQLQEVMGDFWSNHFHASNKDSSVHLQYITDREFFRDNAFGRFEDLLLYSAHSPLMSQFLDNDESRAGAINENYGREIMELHTVGVDGGYGDDDVIAVSRVFTGWDFTETTPSDTQGPREYEFEFRADRHDTEDKVIPFLNTTIAGRTGAAGEDEGEELIAILAADPRTQNYVCGKIVQRFVADVPPADFVQICVDAWAANDGDAGEILRAILLAPDFIANAEIQNNKGKTPFEYSVSAIRALGAVPDSDDDDGDFFDRFRNASEDAGYEPTEFGVPTGLSELGSDWISSAAMISYYNQVTDVVERPTEYNIDLEQSVEDAGLETAEEAAAFLLTIATADNYTLEEYEAVVGVLKGADGIFEPIGRDESDAFERATGLLVVLPSFLLQ